MANPIENFEFILREHRSKKHLALYNNKRQHKQETQKPQDVILSVSAQLKAIQAADSTNNTKSLGKDLQTLKKSTFLCVNKLPMYEEVPKQTNTFDTQFVSNTQLINIIEEAEHIDKHRGMTQEFETSFSQTDKHNRLGGGTAVTTYTDSRIHFNVESDDLTKKIESGSSTKMVDGNVTNKASLKAKFNKNKDSIENSDTCTPKNMELNMTKDRLDCRTHKKCEAGETICDETRYLNNKITTDSKILKANNIKHKDVANNEKDIFIYEVMVENENELNHECIGTDVNTERPPSPIFLINKDCKTRNSSPLVFDLETFERFENFAISMLENNNYEKAKHVINSQILGKELLVKSDENVELESKDIPLRTVGEDKTSLHKIQDRSAKEFEDDTGDEDFFIDNLSTNINEHTIIESQQKNNRRSLEDTQFNFMKINNYVDNTSNLNDPVSDVIDNQSPVPSQILPVNVIKKTLTKGINNYKRDTTFFNEDENLKDPIIGQSNISFLNDEILFSSDEEDIDKEYKDIPFTCALQTSIQNHAGVLGNTMYVGFQTASNRSIQICKDSFDKARSLLSGVDDDETTITELVKICDDSNRNTNCIKVKDVKDDGNYAKDKEAELVPKNKDNNTVVDQNSGFVKGGMFREIANGNRLNAQVGSACENNNFDGFKTASNKIIRLSDKALARCKEVFQDINIDEKYDSQTGIDTKNIHIKANVANQKINDVHVKLTKTDYKDTEIKAEELETAVISMKDECLDDLIHNINDEVIIQEFENIEMSLEEDKEVQQDEGFVGFKTASDKNIRISDEALTKTKNIFKDIDFNEESDRNSFKCDDNDPENYALGTNKSEVVFIPMQNEAEIHKEDINKYDYHISTISCTGFKTANNKVINISKEALAKTNKVFQDIDSVQLNITMETGVKNKDVYPNIDKRNQPSTSTVPFAGFKTGNNKEIKISNTSLAKVKDIIKDIDFREKHSIKGDVTETSASKACLPRLKNIYNEELRMTSTSLAQDEAIFEDKGPLNVEPYAERDKIKNAITDDFNKPSTSRASFGGFKTANNRDIKITEAALTKTRNIFNDIDSINMPKKTNKKFSDEHINANNLHCTKSKAPSFVGFKTANNKDIRISEAAMAKTRNIFNEDIFNTDVGICRELEDTSKVDYLLSKRISTKNFEEVTVNRENITKVMPNTETFQGFKTASNKQVDISKEALCQTKDIFKDICIDGDYNEEVGVRHRKCSESNCETPTDNIAGDPDGNDSKKVAVTTFKGFQTASNKLVAISEQALVKSKNVFKEFDTIDCIENTMLGKANDKLFVKTNPVPTKTEFLGFQTGNSKVINVSEKALIDSRQLLGHSSSCKGNTTTVTNLNVHNRDGDSHKGISNTIDFGFKTANNLAIEVSGDALAKSKKILEDSDATNKEMIDKKECVDVDDINIDTQVINNFEDTLYTEDFRATPLKSKRSGSPILSCPRAKKRKKFETPYSQRTIKNIVKIPVKLANEIKFDINYKRHKLFKLKDLQKYADSNAKIDPYLTEQTYDNLLKFEFKGDRNDSLCNCVTINSLKEIFLKSVHAKLVPEGWLDNHLRLILWKLISYEIRFPDAKILCSTSNVLNELQYRYVRELYNAERPALRKIYERDDLSAKTIVLCVMKIYENGLCVNSVANLTSKIELLLTDGWYCIMASTDRMIAKLVYDRKIIVGTKLVTNGAELVNCDQGMAPWEDTSAVRLKLTGNATRRARWDARLGYHSNAAILTHLSAVNVDGGRVSKLTAYVTRVYPSLYVEKFEDGSTVTRSERLEHLHQTKYETERQIIMEKLYEEVEKEFSDQESQDSEGFSYSGGKRTCLESGTQIAKIMRRSNDPAEFRAQLTTSQTKLLAGHTEKRREKLLRDVQARIREKMEKNGMCATRNVVPVKKIRVVEVEERGDEVEVTKAMISIWKPNEAILEIIEEGRWIDILNVVPTAVRYSEIQISAGRQSLFSQSKYRVPDKLKLHTELLKRKCFTVKDVAHNPTMSTDYNEIDTVGLVFSIDPSIRDFDSNKQLFQNVYLADADKNIVCVNFWGGLRKFGFENVLDTGQIVACGNLQKRAGNTRKNIPQYRVTEFTYFTKTPKNENARIIMDELNKTFLSLDRRKFCEDCIVLKNNYTVIKNYNNENISPYRPNNSDLNYSKNKQFIDSPLALKDNYNLTGLDFESTFKQTDSQDLSKELLLRKKRMNDKISKLKMYGEPPPLSSITILNKSKNAFNSYKSPLLSELGTSRITSTGIPNSKSDICMNVAIMKNTPQKRVLLNDSSISPALDRTYVKSVNPVKLNFNENNDSIVDHFTEEFDGSPPLSLD